MREIRVVPRRAGKTCQLIEHFNEHVPVGTPVLYWPGAPEGQGRKSVTRSKAWVLSSGAAVVMVEGYAGGIALGHVMPYDPTKAGE